MRKAWPNSSSPRSAFTLIEILVVIAIIALLAALLFPAFSRAREGGRQTTCATNLQQLSIAVQQYFQDERRYPDSLVDLLPEGARVDDGSAAGTTIPVNVTGYLKNGSEGLLCPDDDLDNTKPRSSYGTLNKYLTTDVKAASPIVAGTDASPDGDAGQYAYNYWGYDSYGFAYPTATIVAKSNPPVLPQALVFQTVNRRQNGSGPPMPITGVFNHPAEDGSTGAVWDSSQIPARNVLRYSLANRFAPPSTIVTHCVFHRVQTADNLTAAGQLGFGGNASNALDIVLRLDGSAKAVNVSQWKDQLDQNGLSKWQNQTP